MNCLAELPAASTMNNSKTTNPAEDRIVECLLEAAECFLHAHATHIELGRRIELEGTVATAGLLVRRLLCTTQFPRRDVEPYRANFERDVLWSYLDDFASLTSCDEFGIVTNGKLRSLLSTLRWHLAFDALFECSKFCASCVERTKFGVLPNLAQLFLCPTDKLVWLRAAQLRGVGCTWL